MEEEKIRQSIAARGFTPTILEHGPGYVYEEHRHPEEKLIYILEGSMIVWAGDKKKEYKKGEELLIPGNVSHRAVIGAQGCRFFWAET